MTTPTDQRRVPRPCRCVRATHRHGTKRCYLYCGGGCRCVDCSAANSDWQRGYRMTVAARAWNGGSAWADPTGSRRRLQALSAAGWSATELAAHLGTTDSAIFWLRRRLTGGRCLVSTAEQVSQLYDRLAHVTPTGGAVERTRRWAERAGWVEPWRWDGVDMDDPAAQPAPLPAVGDLDEVAVERLMAGTLTIPRGVPSAEMVEAVRRLAAQGLSDPDVGRRVGRRSEAVGKIRERHGIAPGVPAPAHFAAAS